VPSCLNKPSRNQRPRFSCDIAYCSPAARFVCAPFARQRGASSRPYRRLSVSISTRISRSSSRIEGSFEPATSRDVDAGGSPASWGQIEVGTESVPRMRVFNRSRSPSFLYITCAGIPVGISKGSPKSFAGFGAV